MFDPDIRSSCTCTHMALNFQLVKGEYLGCRSHHRYHTAISISVSGFGYQPADYVRRILRYSSRFTVVVLIIVRDNRDRDFIIPGNDNSAFCSRVMEDKVIPALVDECASCCFKDAYLCFPVRGRYSFHQASREVGIRKNKENESSLCPAMNGRIGNYRTGILILISSKHTFFLPVLMTSPSRIYLDSRSRSSGVPIFLVSSSWIRMTSCKFLRASYGV